MTRSISGGGRVSKVNVHPLQNARSTGKTAQHSPRREKPPDKDRGRAILEGKKRLYIRRADGIKTPNSNKTQAKQVIAGDVLERGEEKGQPREQKRVEGRRRRSNQRESLSVSYSIRSKTNTEERMSYAWCGARASQVEKREETGKERRALQSRSEKRTARKCRPPHNHSKSPRKKRRKTNCSGCLDLRKRFQRKLTASSRVEHFLPTGE